MCPYCKRRSPGGEEAIKNGVAPAYLVARWIGCGITATWIKLRCTSPVWHHSRRELGSGGQPTDYYDRRHVLARWNAANTWAADRDRVAAKRLPRLAALCKAWGVDERIGPALVRDLMSGELGLDVPKGVVTFPREVRGLYGVVQTARAAIAGCFAGVSPRYLHVWNPNTTTTDRISVASVRGMMTYPAGARPPVALMLAEAGLDGPGAAAAAQ